MKPQNPTRITVKKNQVGERLDVFLASALGSTRSQVHKLIERGCVLVNDLAPKKTGYRIELGDRVEIIKEPEAPKKKKEKVIAPRIIDETKDYIVIEKPSGILVHPTEAKESGTLTEWLVSHYPAIAKVGDKTERPGIVHRLDKEASGVLVVAKTQKMFLHLKKQFQDRTIEKEYQVLVYGLFPDDHFTIDFPIARGTGGRMAARPRITEFRLRHAQLVVDGKEALTEVFVKQRYARFTLLRVHIHTGRTHQIRVHCFAYGHPVVGDTLYMQKILIKKNQQPLDRLFLHAHKLSFSTLAGERVAYESPLPKELKAYLEGLKRSKE